MKWNKIPKEDEVVLICTEDNYIMLANYHNKQFYNYSNTSMREPIEDVAYWMEFEYPEDNI